MPIMKSELAEMVLLPFLDCVEGSLCGIPDICSLRPTDVTKLVKVPGIVALSMLIGPTLSSSLI